MTSKKDQEETLKSFIQKHSIGKGGISKAPPPITPLSGYGYIPQKTSNPKALEPQKELFEPVTGTELLKKWSVGWEAIFFLASEGWLTPFKPNQLELRRKVEDDSGMLSSVYTQQERDQYFSQWLYRPRDVEAFEAQHGGTLDRWREKIVSKENNKTPQKAETKTGEPRQLKASQQDKQAALDIAEKYIHECKNRIPSIKDAVIIVKQKCTKSMYKNKTIHDWIKNLFPSESRKPGRRPKTTG